MKIKTYSTIAAITLAGALSSQADTILEDDFETPSAGSIPGWTEIGDDLFGGVGVNTTATPDGGKWAYFQTNETDTAGIYQSTGTLGLSGDTITIKFDWGSDTGEANLYTGTFTVSLWDGTPGIGSELDSNVLTDATLGSNNPISISHTLTSDTSNNMFVQFFADVNGAGETFGQPRIDNVLVTQVPEPGSFALIGGALALFTVVIRRRRTV